MHTVDGSEWSVPLVVIYRQNHRRLLPSEVGDDLPLAGRELRAPLADVGVEARWEKAVNDSALCCFFGQEIPGSYDESRTTPAAFVDFVSDRG